MTNITYKNHFIILFIWCMCTHVDVVVLAHCIVHPRTEMVETEHSAIGEFVVLRGVRDGG